MKHCGDMWRYVAICGDMWRYVAICGDMARHFVAICCWVDRDFLSVTQLTRLTKKWRDRRACSKGRVHGLVSQKFRHGTFIYFYDLVLVQLPRVKWFEVTIAESRKKSLNNAMLFARDAALDDNKEPLDWNRFWQRLFTSETGPCNWAWEAQLAEVVGPWPVGFSLSCQEPRRAWPCLACWQQHFFFSSLFEMKRNVCCLRDSECKLPAQKQRAPVAVNRIQTLDLQRGYTHWWILNGESTLLGLDRHGASRTHRNLKPVTQWWWIESYYTT